MSNDVLFAGNQAALSSAADSQLGALLGIIEQYPGGHVQVAGYADKGDGGPEAVAMALSKARAQAVANWLIRHGVPTHTVTVAYYGDTRPVAPDDTAAHRAENRRCVITLTSQG